MRVVYGSNRSRLIFLLAGLPLLAAWCLPALADTPERIISMAPSTTEILFELGLGSRVVGVTRYCDYPEAAKDITKVGGYVDPSYETIVALKPDLVALLTSHRDVERALAKLGIPTRMLPHETLSDIQEAIHTIGEVCGVPKSAATLLESFTCRSNAVQEAIQGSPKPRVLLCIGRDTGADQLSGIYIAGRNGFYDEIIALAGGVNAYRDVTVAYPQISVESIIRMNPDVIIELVDYLPPNGKTAEELTAQWRQLHTVTAVRKHRVHLITGMHALRPGPRYVFFLEELARLLHPERFREESSDE